LVMMTMALVYLGTKNFPKIKDFMRKNDTVMVAHHMGPIPGVVMRQQTALGGACSFIYLFIVCVAFVFLMVQFNLDNDSTIESFVPVGTAMTVDSQSTSQKSQELFLIVTVLLGSYPGDCDEDMCPQGLTIEAVATDGTRNSSENAQQTIKCSYLHETSECSIEWKLENDVAFLSQAVAVDISISDPTVYAQYINWQMQVPSYKSNRTSKLQQTIKASHDNAVFRGTNPTVVVADIFNAVYTKGHAKSNEYGYILSHVTSSRGSEVSADNFYSSTGLKLKFEVSLSSFLYQVTVEQKRTVIDLFGSFFAYVSGIVLVVRGGMVMVERYRQKRKETLKKMQSSTELLDMKQVEEPWHGSKPVDK